MPRRRRRRRTLRWAPVLWLLWIANMCAGLAFSPATRVAQVRVEGAMDFDRNRIVGLLQGLRDVPALRANAYDIEGRFLSLPEARTAELTRNVFGRGVLAVSYKEPVAGVVGYPFVALSSEGILYRAQRLPPGLPRIQIPAPASAPQLALCLGWDGRSLAYVCEKTRGMQDLENATVEVNLRGELCLNSRIGTRIRLGPAERLDEKLEKLAEILRDRPGILRRVMELNLMSPGQAVKVPRIQGAKP